MPGSYLLSSTWIIINSVALRLEAGPWGTALALFGLYPLPLPMKLSFIFHLDNYQFSRASPGGGALGNRFGPVWAVPFALAHAFAAAVALPSASAASLP